jgi:hypothetical protein
MAAEDYFYDYDPDDDQPTIVACKRCGKGGLHGENDDGQWNLYDGRYLPHRCDMQKAAMEDFEVVK